MDSVPVIETGACEVLLNAMTESLSPALKVVMIEEFRDSLRVGGTATVFPNLKSAVVICRRFCIKVIVGPVPAKRKSKAVGETLKEIPKSTLYKPVTGTVKIPV